jgi:hypothetical protein
VLTDTSYATTSAQLPAWLRKHDPGPRVISQIATSGHGGDAIQTFTKTPGLEQLLVCLPAYCPDLNADEAIWKWIREEIAANTCFGTMANVAAALGPFFDAMDDRA